jgi:hypothetical protein
VQLFFICLFEIYGYLKSVPRISEFLRVRPKINLHFQVVRRPHGKARGGRIAGYLTDEQRSHAGWIDA